MSKKKSGGPFEKLRALKEELRAKEEKSREPKKAAPIAPARRAGADEDDALVFHRLFAGVEPLDRSRGRQPRTRIERSEAAARAAARGVEAARAEEDAVRDRLHSIVEGRARFEVADDGRRVEGRRVDLPIDRLRRLRRGLSPIDARLDLHGMTAGEARGQLASFLRTMRARGERCVLVVHGKGEHSPRGVGVLRGEIAAWLSQGSSSDCVAAFSTARDADGGEGAVYVLLAR